MLTAVSNISRNPVHLSSLEARPAATEAAASTSLHQDAVKLSLSQQVRALRAEGESPVQIATSLDLTSTQVTGDLYVSLTWPQLLRHVASQTSFGGYTAASSDS